MARFSGNVGFAETVKTGIGKYSEKITERHYFGDVTRSVRRLDNGTGVNDNISINNEISIIADPYAREHFFAIRYVEWQGTKWKVTTAEALYPRIVLSIGGMYNGSP